MSDGKMIKMVNQKNIIKALNEQKYLRNLQNDFKPKMFFKENRSKAPIRVVEPKSYSAESSAHTINESIFTDDISPFSSYSINSTGSTFVTLDDGEDSNNGSDNTTNDDDSLSKSTKIITDIFDKYSESKTDSLTDSITNTPSDTPNNSPRIFLSDENLFPNSPDNPDKNGSSKLPSFINSNDLFKSATQNNKDKKKLIQRIQRIFVKSPDYTSSVDTNISSASAQGNNSKNLSLVSTEKSTKPLYSADSIDESKIKIKRKNRVFIKKNIINEKVSELIPLKISFFGGSYSNSDETMSYEKCKTVIQSLIEENISVNLKTFLNESLKNAGTTNTSTEPPKCAKEIEEKDKELKKLQNKAEKLEIENKELKELQNKAKELEKPIEIGSTDMGLSELLNASLNKTVNPSQNDTGSNKLINESSNDMKLSELLNASLNGTVNPSQNSNQIINASLTGSSNAKPSAKDDQEYVVEITFNNETLEPIDIIINRADIFDKMEDNEKPSNYLFSVNQFIMEQIKTKNRGYILEGETTMACYLKDSELDFDTAVFSF
jgi:hypothetical protein